MENRHKTGMVTHYFPIFRSYLSIPTFLFVFVASFIQNMTVSLATDHSLSPYLIIKKLNWVDIHLFPPYGKIRQNSRAVGRVSYFKIPKIAKVMGERKHCQAFLISPNLILTNHHCISTREQAKEALLEFHSTTHQETGSIGSIGSIGNEFPCGQLVATSKELDFTLLRCQGRPGDLYGTVKLDTGQRRYKGKKVYIIQINCNRTLNEECEPSPKVAKGKIKQTVPEPRQGIRYNADTLKGSSGAPVFLNRTHEVVALHRAGKYERRSGGRRVPQYNMGVPITRILSYLGRNHPHLEIFHTAGDI